MEIDVERIDDPLILELLQAHELGAVIKGSNSIPCSICRETSELNEGVIKRDHFHGSDFGACKRKVFRTMRDGGRSSSSNAAFLNDGHLHEHSILSNLIAGLGNEWEVKPMENKSEMKFYFSGFEIIGHTDALLMSVSNDGLFLLECKSVKDYTFKKVKGGEISDEWYGQIQTYLLMLQLKVAYLLVKHRETSKLLKPIRIDFNPKYVAERLNVLKEIHHQIISGGEQPNREHTTSKDSECKWCAFGNEIGDKSCWLGKGD